MKILALSTAEPGCSLAVMDGDQLVCETYWQSRLTHSRRLLPMIASFFPDRAGFAVSDLDGILAARGPGSFTGLRIGISAVMGIGFAVSRPVAGVSSLDGIAFRFAHADLPVCAMMDARRSQVYCAVYWFDKGRLKRKTPETVCPPDQAVSMTQTPHALFAGSGARVYDKIIRSHTSGHASLTHQEMHHISAAGLIRSALMSGPDFFKNPENTLIPTYIRQG